MCLFKKKLVILCATYWEVGHLEGLAAVRWDAMDLHRAAAGAQEEEVVAICTPLGIHVGFAFYESE